MILIRLKSEYISLYHFMKPKIIRYAMGLIGSCTITASLIIMQAFAWKYMFNSAVELDFNLLYKSMIVFFIPVLLLVFVSPFFVYLYNSAVKEVMFDIRHKLFSKLVRLPISFYDKHHSGELYSLMANDVRLIESAYSEHLRTILYQFVLIVASLFSMFVISWKMAIPLFLVCVSFALLTSRFSKSLSRLSGLMQGRRSKETQRLIDIIGGSHIIRMFNLYKVIGRKHQRSIKQVTKLGLMLGRKEGQMEGVAFFIGFLNHGGIYVLGAFLLMNGAIELGILTALVSLQINVSFAFLQIGSNLSQLQISLVGITRLDQLHKEQEETQTLHASERNTTLPDKMGIRLEEVCFRYKQDVPLFDRVNLVIEKGSHVAFVGASGSGKTTIAKLILGFYPLQGGNIYIDGQSMDALSLEERRSLIAYVPQDVTLFEGTIMENIRFGNGQATEDEVRAAAEAANAHEFIRRLPEGYGTRIGETGKGLSGGERQRIAIARAVLKNAPFLILDEATSSLDTRSEHLVQEALDRLVKDRTTIVIAHRLSTIEHADMIVVMHNGVIAEQGTHQELISRNGLYHELVETKLTNDLHAAK